MPVEDKQDIENRVGEIETDKRVNLKVPENLESPHSLITDFLDYKKKLKKYGYSRDYPPRIRIAVGDNCQERAVRIYDTFIKACEARGHKFYLKDSDTIIKVYEEEYELRFWEKSKVIYKKEANWLYDTREYEPTGKLFIQLIRRGSSVEKEWGDTPYVTLEEKLARIIANLEIKSERDTKQRLIWEQQSRERKIREELEAQLRQSKYDDLEKFRKLILDSERWSKANEIRNYIKYVESNKERLSQKFENIDNWIAWAKKRVDWYDPLIDSEDDLLSEFNKTHQAILEGKESSIPYWEKKPL